MRASGHTAYELIRQRRYGGAIVEFGEIVWARIPHREEAWKSWTIVGLRSFWLARAEGSGRAHWTGSSWSEEDSELCVPSQKAAGGGAK